MTKKRLGLILFSFITCLGIFSLFNRPHLLSAKKSIQKIFAQSLKKKELKRAIATVTTHPTNDPLPNTPLNKRTEYWQKNLETTLVRHGGQELKSIKIKKEKSFIWKQNNLLLNVESVLIQIQNQKSEETSFRALVDAQTGKILQTWDQPVFDHVNPRENFGLKLDSRYFE